MSDQFNLYPLHIFRLVAQFGSVTRAAQKLFISQPAVSAQLRSLEEYYQAALFERTPRGMLLTPAGAALSEQVNKLFAIYDDLPSSVGAVQGLVRGEVIVAASSTPGAYCVPDLLRRFQEKYPDARSTLVVGDSAQVLEWLREYRFPLGVVGETKMSEGLHCLEIGADELRLVVATADSLSRVRQVKGEHMRKHTLFIRESGSSTRMVAESLLSDLLPAVGRIVEIQSTEAIKQSVIAGLGVAVLSSWATRLEESAGLLRPVRDSRLKRQRRFYLVRREDRALTATAAALWDCLATFEPTTQPWVKRRSPY
jgi:DNA-binding transcriptional LysR family regulator